MNKICTSLEQSNKLLELGLDMNTADMYWWATSLRYYIEAMDDGDFNEREGHIPAWSLSALLDIVPSKTGTASILIRDSQTGKYKCVHGSIFSNSYEESVDAVFEMVCLLKENNNI